MNILELFQPIRTFVFDVDGVLTDGTVLVLDDGQQVRGMNVRDGYALQLAVRKGYRVAVISGGEAGAVRIRLEKLGVQDIFLGVADKEAVLDEYMGRHSITKGEVLYMGDDMPDYPPMERVGLPCCPVDSATEILRLAKYISPLPGGRGCVRDVIEKVLKLNDAWMIEPGLRSR